ncbi:hypothetical protein BW152_10280 [Lactococcus lactis]|nr:hypothetical protein BW152_10280 [Lactococcus lactis]
MKNILLLILLVLIMIILFCILFSFFRALYLFSFRKKRFWASFTDTMTFIFIEIIGEAINPLNWL